MLPCHSNKLSLEIGAHEIEGSGCIKISCKSLANRFAAYILGVNAGPLGTPHFGQDENGSASLDTSQSTSTVDIDAVLSGEEDREHDCEERDCERALVPARCLRGARGMHSR